MAVEVPHQTHSSVVRYVGLFAALLVGFAALMKLRGSAADCATQLNDGEWRGNQWYTHSCFLHHFHTSEVPRCLSNFSDVVLIGDSIHEMYTSMIGNHLEHKLHTVHELVGGNDKTFDRYSHLAEALSGKAALVVDQPIQLYTADAKDIARSCADSIDLLITSQRELLKKAPFSKIITLAPNVLNSATEEVLKCSHLAEEKYSKISNSSIVYLKAPIVGRGTAKHSADDLSEDLNLILNVYCNSPCNATCCVQRPRSRLHGMTAMLVLLAVYGGLWMVWLTGATEPIVVYLEGCAVDTAKLRKAFNYIGVVVLCAFYFTITERLQLFDVTNKTFSPLLFCVWLVGTLAAGISTCARGPQKFLSSQQCSSLIGLMIVVLVGLKYTAMDEKLSFYLLGDLLLGAIVLLSSYKHYMYFWECGSFNYTRVIVVLIRINVPPLIMGVLLGVSYFKYVFPLLLSFGFLIVYISMVTNVQITKVQVQAQTNHIIFTVAKLLLLFLIISFIFSLKRYMFSVPEMLHDTTYRTTVEWLDTLNRHKHMPLCGVALGYIICVLRSHNASTKYERTLKIAGVFISLAIIVCYSFWIFICTDPHSCVQWQSYLSILPILAGIFVCNCSDSLKTLYSHLMQQWGSAFIVLYCSHLHILCSFEGRGLLALFSGAPMLNTFVVVAVFFIVTHHIIKTEGALVDILRRSSPEQAASSFPKESPVDETSQIA